MTVGGVRRKRPHATDRLARSTGVTSMSVQQIPYDDSWQLRRPNSSKIEVTWLSVRCGAEFFAVPSRDGEDSASRTSSISWADFVSDGTREPIRAVRGCCGEFSAPNYFRREGDRLVLRHDGYEVDVVVVSVRGPNGGVLFQSSGAPRKVGDIQPEQQPPLIVGNYLDPRCNPLTEAQRKQLAKALETMEVSRWFTPPTSTRCVYQAPLLVLQALLPQLTDAQLAEAGLCRIDQPTTVEGKG